MNFVVVDVVEYTDNLDSIISSGDDCVPQAGIEWSVGDDQGVDQVPKKYGDQ